MTQTDIKKYGIFAICGSCFFLQLSTTGITLCTIAFILCWVASGAYKDLMQVLRKYPTALIATLLFFLFLCGTLYSPASSESLVDALKNYRILLYVPIILCLSKDRPEAYKYVFNAFIVSSVLALVASYLLSWGVLPIEYSYGSQYHSLRSPTTHGGIMALFIYILLQKIVQKEKNALYTIPIMLLAGHNLFFVTGSSTGLVIIVALILLLAIQYLPFKKLALCVLCLAIVSSLLYKYSPKITHEVDQISNTIQHYEIGSGAMRNNVSLRLDWWMSSYLLVKEKPVTGYGTGAFEKVHDEFVRSTTIEPRSHPHNEYWYTAVQVGIPGVILFTLLLILPFLASFYLEKQQGKLLQAVITFFFLGNFFANWLIGSPTGNFYMIALGTLLISSQRVMVKHD